MIHPTAIVPASARLGENVEIGAYAVVGEDVEIGDNTFVEAHAHIKNGARIGKNCTVCGFSTISGDPQDLHFDKSTVSYVEIGDGTTVREGATVHRATVAGGSTVIGENCLLMANAHVGHDSTVGARSILAPFCALGGFVRLGCDAFVSGGVMVHQKIRVGDGVMLSGVSAFSLDVPPYVNANKRNTVAGLNLIGMRRRKVPTAAIVEVKRFYMAVYDGKRSCAENARALIEAKAYTTPEGENFLRFFDVPDRHFIHLGREKLK